MNYEDKLQLTKELFDILSRFDVKIISAVVLKNSLSRITEDKREANQRMLVLSFILERFNIHVNKINKSGLIIFDSVSNNIMKDMKEDFFNISNNKKDKIFNALLFSNDEYSNLLQVADLIGYALNKAIYDLLKENKPFDVNELPFKNDFLEIYWPLFEFNPQNDSVNGWGLKVWY